MNCGSAIICTVLCFILETDGRAGGNTNAERSSRCLFGDAKSAVEHVVRVGGVAAGFSRKKWKSLCHSDHHRENFLRGPVPTEFVPIECVRDIDGNKEYNNKK